MPDLDDRLRNFVDFLAKQPMAPPLTYDEVALGSTRAELGISSLNILILVNSYIEEKANGRIALRPEWVPLLDNVEGILSVLDEIDACAPAEV
ncbi:hypothetical protein [Nonomuraea gerenzanensis]|uniref:Carrier domain-containing protein n=1 Tax=Nonomuraea gerenzanensis TaxID=93944 RepID=A0A1M4EM48_9ACTN|nr:hypothetical protein [Nonomuraea gerenzanensis]UBU11412.1 hypothetical protein LCN96_45025 [Nonomuraea gerenzanensis]SBO99895.1 hypothetical protein BN4615_P9411 [Nonomuraea gerenzanensis]